MPSTRSRTGPRIWCCAVGRHHPVLGNADLLRRAIENVVRNAIFYTPVGTRVEIVVSRKPPGLACVATIDHGPGVPAAALDHLFEPFYRVDEARARDTGGSGIGLAICQRVVRLHGGAARARNNEPHGLIVEIELPSGAIRRVEPRRRDRAIAGARCRQSAPW